MKKSTSSSSSSSSYLASIRDSESVQLIGRSRAERQLDSIFHKQAIALKKSQLLQQKKHHINSNRISSSAEKLSTDVRFSAKRVKTEEGETKTKDLSSSKNVAQKKGPLEALHEIITKHISNIAKYPKAVDLVSKLWKTYISKDNKNAFLCALDKIVNTENCTFSAEGRKEVIDFMEEGVLPMISKNKEKEEKNEKSDYFSNPSYLFKKRGEIEKKLQIIAKTETENEREEGREENKSSEEGNNYNSVMFNEEEEEYINILCIRAIHNNKIFTDDPFQFNKCMTHFKSLFEELLNEHRAKMNENTEEEEEKKNEEKEEEKKNEENQASTFDSKKDISEREKQHIDNIIKKEQVEEENKNNEEESENKEGGNGDIFFSDLFSSWELPNRLERMELKRRLFFDSLKTIFSMRNIIWARSSVESFFQSVYINRNIFDANEVDQISYWQTELKTKGKAAKTFEVYSIGEAANPVKDGRDERVVTTHGAVVWSSKQIGL